MEEEQLQQEGRLEEEAEEQQEQQLDEAEQQEYHHEQRRAAAEHEPLSPPRCTLRASGAVQSTYLVPRSPSLLQNPTTTPNGGSGRGSRRSKCCVGA